MMVVRTMWALALCGVMMAAGCDGGAKPVEVDDLRTADSGPVPHFGNDVRDEPLDTADVDVAELASGEIATCAAADAAACDDGNPCTQNVCDPAAGCRHPPVEAGAACDDGDPCTLLDTCLEGNCVGEGSPCDHDNPCTAASCDPTTGECEYLPQSNLPCSDSNACTNNDLCVDGECVGGAPVDCDDSNACTVDECVELSAEQGGGCTHEPAAGEPCDDLNPCTQNDACLADGTCNGTAVDCDDANPCTSDHCTPPGGCYHEPENGNDCEDDDPCTATGKCMAGACVPGPIKECDDGVACTADGCGPDGECLHLPEDEPCDDGAFCNGAEWCDAQEGCREGSAPDADDGNPCTQDSCDEATDSLLHVPVNAACDDADACSADVCDVEEGCMHFFNPCEDADLCTQDGCDPATGECLHTAIEGCCTADDECVPDAPCLGGLCNGVSQTCDFHPLLCDDFDPCTLDACDDGCQHEAVPDCFDQCAKDLDCRRQLPAGELCTAATCVEDGDLGIHTCQFAPRICDDGRACTLDACEPAVGCQYWPVADCQASCSQDSDCDDADPCSQDACVDGQCQRLVETCDDGLKCTGGECNNLTGQCELFECPVCQCPFCAVDADCDDGDKCTLDRCVWAPGAADGVCRHLNARCLDGDPCTFDFCLPDKGCVFINNGACTGCHLPTDCDDGDPCTQDDCAPDGLCTRVPICGAGGGEVVP